MSNSSLDRIRQAFVGPMIALLWVAAAIATAAAFGAGHRLAFVITGGSVLAATAATLVWRSAGTGQGTRWATSIALMLEVALLVLAAEGTVYQPDMHMAFFAALAVVAGWVCPVSIGLATVFVAVHHLLLNFVYPAAVFPNGADLLRVVIHAVILLTEAGVLFVLAQRLILAVEAADAGARAANEALAARSALEQERSNVSSTVRDTRRETEDLILATVGEIVAAAKDGNFTHCPQPSAALGRLAPLVTGMNEVNHLVDRATHEFLGVLGNIARGDLTHAVQTDYRGRFGELKDALNETIERLSETVGTIKATAEDVGLASREINSGANDLSQRTEQQASSLEETAATTEELAASVKASAQSSRQAVDLSQQAMGVASEGGSIVKEAIEAMARIEQASQKISDITGVIDEIAFQTNLLALNAAVEAARAGEAGKGFAVVASEVRTLAQRSSEAAKDITGLIGASGNEVAQGVKLVRAAGDALEKIVDASRKVSATVSEISAASGEQANGIDEMSQAVAHMDEMTQQNAALAEESAASAAALSSQIERLNDLVATFRTRDMGRPAMSSASLRTGTGGGGVAPAPVHAPPPKPAAKPAARSVVRAQAPKPRPAAAAPAPRPAASNEPDRLRQLAAEAFAKPAPARAPAAKPAPAPAPKRPSASTAPGGWEEF